jgi:primosomal protein N' (replication factor Y)
VDRKRPAHRRRQAIGKRLEKKEQVILFLNRRGFSTHVHCQDCGHVCHNQTEDD